MVVAAGAAERQAQERPADRVDLLVDDVHLHLGCVDLGQHLGPRARKPVAINCSCRSALRSPPGSRSPAICSRRNRSYGLSPLKRGDDVIAIAPGVAVGHVLVEAVGVGVAGHVEPVPAPPLAVRRRGQQPIDHPIERVGPIVGEERVNLVGRRRQTGQVERHPANECSLVGRQSPAEGPLLPVWPTRTDRLGFAATSPSRTAGN